MRLRRKKKVVLALGAGGARGLAHIGVIRALNEAGIPIDAIAGVSFGAIIGALYSLYLDIRYILPDVGTGLRRLSYPNCCGPHFLATHSPFFQHIASQRGATHWRT